MGDQRRKDKLGKKKTEQTKDQDEQQEGEQDG